MPVTPAHAIVALPFRGSRRWSAAAVAAGSVAPDLPLFLTGGAGYGATHSLWAIPTIDVVLGLGCLLLWWGLLRPGVLALMPAGSQNAARRRFPPALLPVAIAIGALTHVVWDAFTHAALFGTALLPVLATRVGPLALTSWLQYASGVGGAAMLLGVGVVALRRRGTTVGDGGVLGRRTIPARAVVLALPIAVAAIAVFRIRQQVVVGGAFAAVTAALLGEVVAVATVGAAVRLIGRGSRR